jgi:flavorubredoxin
MAIHVSNPADDVVALTDVKEIPGLGFLPVNAYVVQAEQPLLVDSGLPTSRPDFLQALWARIEPADLRWIYLTHPDRDHTGSLMEILHAAPAARLITTFLGLGILSLEYQIDLERVFLLNPRAVARPRRPTPDRLPSPGLRQSRDDRLLRSAHGNLFHI